MNDKLDDRDMTNHQGCDVRVEGLAPIDRSNYEEQARLQSMDHESHVKS